MHEDDRLFLESARLSQQRALRDLESLYRTIKETRDLIQDSRKLLMRLAAEDAARP
jgi:hypothetical protein